MRRLAALTAAAFLAAFLAACGPGPAPPAPTSSPTTPHPTLTAPASPSPSPSPSPSWTWPPTQACGVERWPVKTGTDPDASKVDLSKVTDTTIAQLTALQAPSNPPQNGRVAPVETTVYRVHATLLAYKMEGDSDYHLELSDGQGHTMIAEIPDPACVSGGQNSSSPFLPGIEAARAAFDARYTPTGSYQQANVQVVITGVGFFDFIHGQLGVAPNGIELHPVLSITFGG